jgi:hypothetical protein
LADKIVEPTRSPYNSPILLVQKANGEFRFVTDYRKLNEATVPDRFPMTRQDNIYSDIQGMSVFTSLDLRHGFWQVLVDPDSRPYTAMSVPGIGQLQYIRLPFGLRNSPATFCRVIAAAIEDAANLSFNGERVSVARAYVDDVIIASTQFQHHIKHLEMLFTKLDDAKLTVNLAKCDWAKPEVKFLGHIVSSDGVRLDPGRTKRIQDWVAPTNRNELRSFLGFANWCRNFVPNYAQLVAPLNQLNSTKVSYIWTKEHQRSFDTLKEAFSNPSQLAMPIYDGRPFIIFTDASDTGVGASLLQEQNNGGLRPISHTGRTFTKTESFTYSTSDKECLALVYAIKHFRNFFEGYQVRVKTDHAALQWLASKPVLKNKRMQQWAATIQSIMPEIQYIKGEENVLADALSRMRTTAESELADNAYPPRICNIRTRHPVLERIKEAQSNDSKMQDIVSRLNLDALDTQQVPKSDGWDKRYSIHDDILMIKNRIWIPQPLRREIFELCHGSLLGGHLGRHRTLDAMRDVFWRGMSRDVHRWTARCEVCQRAKPKSSSFKPQLLESLETYEPFHIVNIDMMGPLKKTVRRNEYILTVVDKASRYLQAFAVRDLSTETLAQTLLERYFSIFGFPKILLSDQGTNFMSLLLGEINKLFMVEHRFSPTYAPWVNGSAERANGTIMSMLRAFTNGEGLEWDTALPCLVLAYNSTASRTTYKSPFELIFARPPPSPLLPIQTQLAEVTTLQERFRHAWQHAASHDEQYRDAHLALSQPVTSSDDFAGVTEVLMEIPSQRRGGKLAARWEGPYQIHQRISRSRIDIVLKDGSIKTIHTRNLKPFRRELTQIPATADDTLHASHTKKTQIPSNDSTEGRKTAHERSTISDHAVGKSGEDIPPSTSETHDASSSPCPSVTKQLKDKHIENTSLKQKEIPPQKRNETVPQQTKYNLRAKTHPLTDGVVKSAAKRRRHTQM